MKRPIYQNFDVGLRSDKIDFWKSQICILNDFWRVDISRWFSNFSGNNNIMKKLEVYIITSGNLIKKGTNC